ncbi:MAG: hypothetical protein NXI24_05830 [bacterium]|nr:hypothetical protein [bacterium]
MVREFILVSISVLVGLALTGWSSYMIVRYYRTPKEGRPAIKAYFKVAWLFLLIGLADLGKAVKDLIQVVRLASGEPADPTDL